MFGIVIALVVKGCTTPDELGWIGTTSGPSTTAHTPPWFGDTVSAWGVELGLWGPTSYDNVSTTLVVGDGNELLIMGANINNTESEDFTYKLAGWEGRIRPTASTPQQPIPPTQALTNRHPSARRDC